MGTGFDPKIRYIAVFVVYAARVCGVCAYIHN